MVSKGYIKMLHIASKYIFTAILIKHWGYQGTYQELIQSVFCHVGNTGALFFGDTLEVDVSIG